MRAPDRIAHPWRATARGPLGTGTPGRRRGPGTVTGALRCLCELGDPRDRGRLLRAIQHTHADVRLGALQALHKQARTEDSQVFMPLLADTSWWVRQAAADSLAALPGITRERLDLLLTQVADRYGQDAPRRAIAEVRR